MPYREICRIAFLLLLVVVVGFWFCALYYLFIYCNKGYADIGL